MGTCIIHIKTSNYPELHIWYLKNGELHISGCYYALKPTYFFDGYPIKLHNKKEILECFYTYKQDEVYYAELYLVQFLIEKKKEIAVKRIQRWWRCQLANPYTDIGKKWINKQFEEYMEYS